VSGIGRLQRLVQLDLLPQPSGKFRKALRKLGDVRLLAGLLAGQVLAIDYLHAELAIRTQRRKCLEILFGEWALAAPPALPLIDVDHSGQLSSGERIGSSEESV
jgi:hypothetical protein